MSKRQTKSTTPGKERTTTAAKKTAPKRETIASLREHVDSIVSRLKTADTNNRKSVKALENAISALEKQVKNIDHDELSDRVDELSAHLTKSIDTTKRDIASDLRSALENPTVSGLEAAIERSEQRLADTEMAQARALSKVNKHLAELARVIDARFRNQEGETKENSAKISELEGQVHQSYERLALIENTAAEAIRKVGDEVVGTAETFQSRLEAQNASLRERIEAIAARTKEDFDQQKTDLSRRMESIEDSQKNQSNYIDRSISKLAARIDSLEFGLTNTPEEPMDMVPPPPFTPPSAPENAYSGDQALNTYADPAISQSVHPIAVQEDAFAPIASDPAVQTPHPVMESPATTGGFVFHGETPPQEQPPLAHFIEEPAPELETEGNIFDQLASPATYQADTPYSDTSYSDTPPPAIFTDSGMDTAAPQLFQPQPTPNYVAPQHHYVDPAQAVPAPTGQLAYNYDPYNALQESPYQAAVETPPQAYDYSQAVTPGQPVEFTPPIAEADLPYENPGYGEGERADTMNRPGHVTGIREKRKKKRSDKSLLNSSALSNLPVNPKILKVAGLALAVSLIGFLGLRGYMGDRNESSQPAPVASLPAGSINDNMSVPTVTSDFSTVNPISDLPDNTVAAPENVAFTGSQSLKDAAESGNAIAQFQLGISYLDAGRTKDGLDYVRKAANQKQPAAQYRLAKLYEGGIGVKSDPDMARQLTELAATAGNRIAMHDLGLYYAEGRGGVERNLTTAVSWFEKAAERGVVDSQYNLGILYGSTPEIPQDMASAYFWFSVAAAQGDQFAGNQIGNLKQQMGADQLKQAEARIAAFKPVAINEAANGIFREVPWSVPGAESFKPTADLVRDAQSLLGQLGYDVGAPDGDMGPKTRSAVKAFEKANGLPETGAVTGSLIDRLEAAAGV